MRTIDRYIVRQLLSPTALAIAVISFIIVCSTVQKELKSLGSEIPAVRIAISDIVQMGLFGLPTLIGMIFPITLMVGTTSVFSRMGRDSEITALRASGISLKRTALPMIMVGALLSVVSYFVLDIGQPWGYHRMTDILFNDLPKRVSLDALRTGQMHTIGKRQIYIGEREQDGTLRNLVVKEQQNDTASAIYYADAANFTRTDTGQTITMQNVWHMQSGSGTISTPPRFASASLFIPTMERPPRSGQRRGQSVPQLIAGLPDMKANYQRLRDQPDAKESELKRATATLRNQRIEIAERFSFPLMCFAVTMVAAPLAVKTRRGGRSMAFSTGLAIIVGYFVLRKIVEPEFPFSLPTTILLVQIPNLTLCALGALFLCRIDRT